MDCVGLWLGSSVPNTLVWCCGSGFVVVHHDDNSISRQSFESYSVVLHVWCVDFSFSLLFIVCVPFVFWSLYVCVQVDHDLSRTVLVTTKLDTKLPQFGAGEDLEDFLR